MITLNSILVASPIALALQHRDNPLSEKTADFVQALNRVSTGATPLSPDNLSVEVPAGTVAGSDHSALQQEIVAHIETGVRNSFKQIRQYLRPLDLEIREALSSIYTPTSALTCIHNNFYIRYVELNHPFFDSPLFPTATPSTVWDYQQFESRYLTEYGSKFPEMDMSKIEALLNSTSEELASMIDYDVAARVYNEYFARGNWSGLFITEGNRFVLDRDVDLASLIQLYIIASRLDVEETVLEGVEGLTLDQYRSYIKTVLNVTIYSLQRTRNRMAGLAQQNMPVMKENIGKHRAEYGSITGDMTIGMTDRAIELIEAQDTSITEVLMGYVAARAEKPDANHVAPLDAIPEYLEKYQTYVNHVQSEILKQSVSAVRRIVETKVNDFQKQHEEFHGVIEKFNEDLPYRRLLKSIEDTVDKWVHQYRDRVINGEMDVEVFLSTPVISIAVAKQLGMTFSAEVLTRSVVTSDMSLEQQRAKLAEAVTECVVGLCLGKNL
ncbi:hypothetical protein [Vibrio phage phiKT1028]|nr:hypothetical protein [Vibrio phage phiKT1028]